MLVAAESGYSSLLSVPIARASHILERPQGMGIVLHGDRGNHYLWTQDPAALLLPAFRLPTDEIAVWRNMALARYLRFIAGKRALPLPPPLRLTPLKVALLIQELHALDFHLAGIPPREIAVQLLDRDARGMRAIEWKSSALRRKVMRLISGAEALMNGGYRGLLRGQ